MLFLLEGKSRRIWDMKSKEEYVTGKKDNHLITLESKYAVLLEKHIKLLKLLVKVANEAEHHSLKQKLNKLIGEIN